MFRRIGDFFRVTVSQQRGIAVLVAVLLLFLAAVTLKEWRDERRSRRMTLVLLEPGAGTGDSLFVFDPSTADSATFVRLGFSGQQARTIIRYRAAVGGRFSTAGQFARCRAVSPDMYARLEPYIRLEPDGGDSLHRVEGDFSPLDINRATEQQLRGHAALDARLAGRIFRARKRYGGFVDLSQMMQALPSDSTALRALAACMQFDTTAIVRYQVNLDSESLLASHPYISRPFARQIVLYRQQHGAVPLYDTLRGLKYFPRSKQEYLRFYLTFDTLKNKD